MIIFINLVALFVLFFFVRHHTGPAHLAMIAGLSVYELFGVQFSEWIHSFATGMPLDLIKTIVYVALILVFPLILYLRSSRGGMSGILRIVEAALFSALLTSLLSATLAKYISFDGLATQISSFISSIGGTIVLVGIASAYFDILLYHK